MTDKASSPYSPQIIAYSYGIGRLPGREKLLPETA